MCTQSVLNEISRQVVEEAKLVLGDKLDKVILYGSYARGDFDEESDIDIMILADIPAEDAWRYNSAIISKTSMLGLEYDVLISPYVKDCATFYKWLSVEPFYQNVLRDGVELIA
ncbi:MAG: nucleotidyltransferase domain-containing protein [Oscillospiraceae bacterium]|jgi:predicted nucleotidyltransferase|nr:nucleotidyltransferase domain-containing protein [Oscillospiraceae bacterium]